MSKKKQDNELQLYRRLADISFRTSITILAIIFAFAFNPQGVSPNARTFIRIVSWLTLSSNLFSASALFGKKQRIRFVKAFGSLSIILIVLAVFAMVAFLISALPY